MMYPNLLRVGRPESGWKSGMLYQADDRIIMADDAECVENPERYSTRDQRISFY